MEGVMTKWSCTMTIHKSLVCTHYLSLDIFQAKIRSCWDIPGVENIFLSFCFAYLSLILNVDNQNMEKTHSKAKVYYDSVIAFLKNAQEKALHICGSK